MSYFECFCEGYSLRRVLGIQKYIYKYHTSQLMMPFSVFDLLLFNRWHTWWGEKLIKHDVYWRIWWPISFLLATLGVVKTIRENFSLSKLRKHFLERNKFLELILLIWTIAYLAFLSLGQATVRYFYPLLPILYILAMNFLSNLFKINRENK